MVLIELMSTMVYDQTVRIARVNHYLPIA